MLRENEKRIQCSMRALHSSGVHRWYCICLFFIIIIIFINGVWYDLWRRREIIGLGCWLCRPAISSAERFNCYIVNRASTSWKPRFARAQPGWAGWPPNRWIKRRLPCFCASACACASVCVACLWKTSLFSLSAADQCLPLRGRLCSRWPTLHECECWSLPFPPPSSGETGTTSFRKKEKKKSSWSFKRHGITLSAKSCPVRRWDFAGKSDPECCSSAFLGRVAALGIL